VQALQLGRVPGGLPTGALFRSEFGTVVVQADVCNGCGYCVPACPFG
jgi:formate dehydrogenase iron-sulfur subunit